MKDDQPSISKLVGEPDQLRFAMEKLEQNKQTLCEATAVIAAIRRASYKALRKQGFNEAQALFLCNKPFGDF